MNHMGERRSDGGGRGMVWHAVASLIIFGWISTVSHAAEGGAPITPTQTAAPSLFDTLDVNSDQVLSRQEFQSGYAVLQRLITVQVRLREQFGVLDTNRSGAIDVSEYAELELIKSQGRAAPSLSTFDTDHDMTLNFSEYATLVRKLTATRLPAKN